MVSPIRKLRVLNANQFLSVDPDLNAYLKQKTAEYGIEVIYGVELKKVDENQQKLWYSENGKLQERDFNLLYVHLPA